MKRTPIKRKTQLKRGKTSLRRTKLRPVGKSTTAQLKRDIQSLVREIVIIRDGGCVLRNIRHCGGEAGVEGVVLQADHLIERSNSATYADPRLVVCVCRRCHGWKHFKKSNHDEYDQMIRKILPKDRVELWDRCRSEKWKAHKMDWEMERLYLKHELKKLSTD